VLLYSYLQKPKAILANELLGLEENPATRVEGEALLRAEHDAGVNGHHHDNEAAVELEFAKKGFYLVDGKLVLGASSKWWKSSLSRYQTCRCSRAYGSSLWYSAGTLDNWKVMEESRVVEL
jgi:hypothetical protein